MASYLLWTGELFQDPEDGQTYLLPSGVLIDASEAAGGSTTSQSLSASCGVVASVTDSLTLGRGLTGVSSITPALTYTVYYKYTLSSTVGVEASMTKTIKKAMSAVCGSVTSMVRSITKTLTGTCGVTPTVNEKIVQPVTLSVSAAVLAFLSTVYTEGSGVLQTIYSFLRRRRR